MKKILILGAFSLTFVAATTHAAKKDTKKKDYWTVEFRKVGKGTLPLLGNYILELHSDTSDLLLHPGDIGKLRRSKNFKIKAKLHYSEVKNILGNRLTVPKHHSYKTKFNTKKHYITVKVIKNPWKLWLTPKLKISKDKKNSGLEKRASTRLNKLRGEFSRRFKRGCIGPKACQRMNELKYKLKILK